MESDALDGEASGGWIEEGIGVNHAACMLNVVSEEAVDSIEGDDGGDWE